MRGTVFQLGRKANTRDGNPRLNVWLMGTLGPIATEPDAQAAHAVAGSLRAHGERPEGLVVEYTLNAEGRIIAWSEVSA